MHAGKDRHWSLVLKCHLLGVCEREETWLGLEGRVGLGVGAEVGEEVTVAELVRVHLLAGLLGVGRRAGFVFAATRAGATRLTRLLLDWQERR